MRAGFQAPWTLVPLQGERRMSDSPAHLQAVREGMVLTVHGPGTATNIRHGLAYRIAGKTGTAQVDSRRGSAAVNPRSLPMHQSLCAAIVQGQPDAAERAARTIIAQAEHDLQQRLARTATDCTESSSAKNAQGE